MLGKQGAGGRHDGGERRVFVREEKRDKRERRGRRDGDRRKGSRRNDRRNDNRRELPKAVNPRMRKAPKEEPKTAEAQAPAAETQE